MKIVTWNINGIRALVRKDLFSSFVAAYDPDVICLQETRVQSEQIMLDLPSHPYQYWNGAERKGYSGTAVLAKTLPVAVHYDMGVARHDREGRLIAESLPNSSWSRSTCPMPNGI